MFRFNRTLKDFSEILYRGRFRILEQYSANEIWHYYKENHNSYSEKKGKYVGHLETKSKLDYFPTNYAIQYATLPKLFTLKKREDYISRATKNFIKDYVDETNLDTHKQYGDLIQMGRFDLIDECFKSTFNITDPKEKVVVADLFAGEGEWLNLFKKMINNNYLYTVANEIEENRYKECVDKKFSMVFNKSYEELTEFIPKKFINVMLFNPPYGETDGQRNVERFYNMMIKDEFLAENAMVIFVINKLDYDHMLPIIAKRFEISSAGTVDTGNEQERLKQVVIIARYANYERYRMYVDRAVDYYGRPKELDKYPSLESWESYVTKNVRDCFDEFNVFKNPNLYKSDFENSNWQMFTKTSKIDSFQGQRIKLAEKPKNLGAAANLISSGLINGEITGEHEHCVAAGISEQTTKMLDEETGNIIVTKKSSPFLSVLTGGNIIQITGLADDNVDILNDGTVVVS